MNAAIKPAESNIPKETPGGRSSRNAPVRTKSARSFRSNKKVEEFLQRNGYGLSRAKSALRINNKH